MATASTRSKDFSPQVTAKLNDFDAEAFKATIVGLPAGPHYWPLSSIAAGFGLSQKLRDFISLVKKYFGGASAWEHETGTCKIFAKYHLLSASVLAQNASAELRATEYANSNTDDEHPKHFNNPQALVTLVSLLRRRVQVAWSKQRGRRSSPCARPVSEAPARGQPQKTAAPGLLGDRISEPLHARAYGAGAVAFSHCQERDRIVQ